MAKSKRATKAFRALIDGAIARDKEAVALGIPRLTDARVRAIRSILSTVSCLPGTPEPEVRFCNRVRAGAFEAAHARDAEALIRRHRALLPAEDVARALGEAVLVSAPVVVPRRGRGAPRIGALALTGAERNKRYRTARNIVEIQVEKSVALRITALRVGDNDTTTGIIGLALDALARERARTD